MGILFQLLTLLLQFISRTVFIRSLGVEYLGINGLFSNILTVLSLADLGVGNAMVYSLYKPLAENDQVKLAALVHYYKKIYTIIAAAVGIVGIVFLPFLGYFVKLKQPVNNLSLYYILYLANTVISYLFVYRTVITTADQKDYTLKRYNMGVVVLQFLLQILALLCFHSFALYIIALVFCTFLANFLCARKTVRMYPYIKNQAELEEQAKEGIWSNVKSFFVYQIGGVALNNTDNILISIILGTVWVGYYSNYSMIIAQVASFTSTVFISLQASVGNLNAGQYDEKRYLVFKGLNLMSFWIYGFCCICFCILFQDFISLWLGNQFLLDMPSIFMAIATFYLQGVLYPIWCYRNTTGLFKQTKYVMLAASAINLVLSVWLGYLWGLAGILGATVIARLSTNIWYEPMVLYRDYFHKNVATYFKGQIGYFLLLTATGAVTFLLCRSLPGTTVPGFAVKLLLCLIVPNFLFYLVFRKTSDFQYLKKTYLSRILNFLRGRSR